MRAYEMPATLRASLPNFLTLCRILGCIPLVLFTPRPSFLTPFWLLYFFLGLTDMADGFLARRLHAVSPFGARLDSVADLCFLIVAALKLWSLLAVPAWLWLWAAVIAVIKIAGLIRAIRAHGKCVFPHSFANKLTGLLLFVSIPFVVCYGLPSLLYPVALLASWAAVRELYTSVLNANRQNPSSPLARK